ncbi:hypothetical protein FB472_0408 [Rhodoglobus vestalii]|uniref:Uncharacterized protein n=2 Tax=Rhodoglobus vestalii TaxID=193384 RepID=A0A8H2PW63_9MICO|nr:hypothetical protein FB472_0408 [Rhodoglobus vestalii]
MLEATAQGTVQKRSNWTGRIYERINPTDALFAHRNAISTVLAVLLMIVGLLAYAPAAAANEAKPTSITLSNISDLAGVTEEQWDQAVADLIGSEVPRTVNETIAATDYTFHIAVDDPAVPSGEFDFSVAVPKVGVITPSLGAGSDARGPYILLNNFDQQVLVGGGSAAITAALCAIPAIGWISCTVITAVIVVAAAWITTYGVFPQNMKSYLFQQYARHSCVNY